MKKLIFICLIFSGCNSLPQLYQSVEKIADDDAIYIMVSQEAIQRQKDVLIQIDITDSQGK